MSGPAAIRIAGTIFRGKAKPEEMTNHVLHQGEIRDPDVDALVDSVLLAVMRTPNSYTGEDMVEIYGHGGPIVLAETLGLLFRKGAAPARPGEFSRRAFLNGRMDLSEAEAVLDLIRARTKEAAHSAVLGLTGKRREMLESLRSGIMRLLAMVEASIDFPEDETMLDRPAVIQRIRDTRERVAHLVEAGTRGKLMRTGLTVAIVGKPNVGKSSLLNALLKEERAIVTPVPGTTRDYLAEWIDVAGIPVRLIDTAGLRETESSVELHGVSRARKAMEESDLVLVLLDWSGEMTEEDEEVLRAAGDKRKIVLLNKCDLDRVLDASQLEGWLAVSAKYGNGLDKLLECLSALVWEGKGPVEDTVFTRARHLASLRDLDRHLEKSAGLLESGQTEEIVAIELRDGLFSIAEIAGETTTDEILDTIFSEFCIGK
jgi:tRNA modification GTPase